MLPSIGGFLSSSLGGAAGAQIKPDSLRATLQQAVLLIAQSGGHAEGGADAAQALQRMCQHNNVCGRVWKKDETAYKCRNCEMDPTCAICVDCFDPAVHAGHDYSIIRTGGGCCDCGDPQAWRPDGFCRQHRGASEDSDPLQGVPPPVVANARAAVRVVGRFLADRLDDLAAPGAAATLQAGAVATLQEALAWLTALCSLGDALRRVTCEELCRASSSSEADCGVVSRLMQFDRLPNALATSVHNLYFQLILDVPFKTTFTRLFIANYPRYIRALMEAPEEEGPSGSGSAVGSGMDNFSVQLFTVPNLTPRCVREGGLLHTLLNTLHASLQRTLVRAPPPPASPEPPGPASPASAPLPSPEQPTPTGALSPPARPAAAAAAGGEGGAGEWRARLPEQIDCGQTAATDKYYWRVTTDLRYVLAHPSVAQHALYARLELFESIVRIYARMHGINPQVRAEGAHVEHESDAWQFAFTLEMEALQLLPPLLAGLRAGEQPLADGAVAPPPDAPAGREPARLRELLAHVVRQLATWFSQAGMAERVTAWGLVADGPAGPGDAYTFHLPLIRLHAALATEAARLWPLPLPALLPGEAPFAAPCMADQLLRLQLFLAQIRAGLWVRNGRSLLSQLGLYAGVHCFWLDWDLAALQICALAIGPERFMRAALARWRLDTFFRFDARPDGRPGEAWAASVAEELLVLLVRLLQERSRSGLSVEAAVRRELIHRLAAEDCTHSHVLKHISKRAKDCKRLEAILKEVATYQAPDHVRLQQGRYVLRGECWREVDRFYPHYSRRDLQALDDRIAALPPRLAPTHSYEPEEVALLPAFRELPAALSARLTFALVAAVLHAATANSPRSTHGLLSAAIRLLARLCRSAAGRPPCTCPEPVEGAGPGALGVAEAAEQLPSEWDPAPNILQPIRIQGAAAGEGEEAGATPVFRILDGLLAVRAAPSASLLQRNDADLVLRLAAERGGPCGDAIRRAAAAAAAAPPPPSAAHATGASSGSAVGRGPVEGDSEDGAARRRALKERQLRILEEFKRKQAAFAATAATVPQPPAPDPASSPVPDGPVTFPAATASEGAAEGAPVCALCRERGAGPDGRPITYISFVQPSRLLALAHPNRAPPTDKPRIVVGPPPVPGAKPRSSAPSPRPTPSRPIPAPPQPQQPAPPTISPAAAAAAVAVAAAAAAAGGGPAAAAAAGAVAAMTATAGAAAAAGGGRVAAQTAATALAQALMQAGRAAVEAAQEAGANARRRAEAALAAAGNTMQGGEPVPAPEAPPAEDPAEQEEAAGEAAWQLVQTLAPLADEDVAMADASEDEEEEEEGAEGRRQLQREAMAEAAQAEVMAEEQLVEMEFEEHGFGGRDDDDGMDADGSEGEQAAAGETPGVLDEEGAAAAAYEAIAGVPFDERPAACPHLSFCGHAIHAECFERYLASLVQRHQAMRSYEGDAIIELERAEFLCPTCRRLSNALVPLPLEPRPAPAPAAPPPAEADPLRAAVDLLAGALRAAGADGTPAPAVDGAVGVLGERVYCAQRGLRIEAAPASPLLLGAHLWAAAAYTAAARELAARPPPGGPAPSSSSAPPPAASEWGPRDGPAMRALVRCAQAAVAGARRGRALDALARLLEGGTASFGAGAAPGQRLRPLLAHDALQLLAYLLASLPPGPPAAPLQQAALLTAYAVAAHQALLSLHVHAGAAAEGGAEGGAEGRAALEAYVRLMETLSSVATSPSPAASPALAPRASPPAGPRSSDASPSLGPSPSSVPIPVSPQPPPLSLGLSTAALSPPSFPIALSPPVTSPLLTAAASPVAVLTDFAPGPSAAREARGEAADVLGRLQRALLPFLRRARLLLALLEPDGAVPLGASPGGPPEEEFAALLGALRLPPLSQLLASRAAALWLRQASRAAGRAAGRPGLAQLMPVRARAADEPFRLAPLPYLFEELYKRLLAATCPACETLPAYHGVCLFCGTLVCVGGRCCRDEGAREGECNSHMRRCGAGVGVFLVLRMSMLLLLRGRRRTFWPAPYLDKYGEEDIEFKRGKPLFLCQSRYEAIERLVATHALDSDPRVLELTIRRDAAWY